MFANVKISRAALVAGAALAVLAVALFAAGRLHRGLPVLGAAKSVNILFLGADSGRLEGNTDTIVLAHVDPSARRVVALWIPRDTRVEIPGHGLGKINAANPAGGPELAVDTVERLLDVPIDYYVLTDFKAAARVIDHLGGVDIDVPARMDYDDPRQDLHIHLAKGRQHLNGEQAIGFARFRQEAMGDIARTQHQQSLAAALLDQVFTPAGLTRLPGAIRLALESSRTNAGLTDLAGLIAAARRGGWTILTETLPGAFLNLNGVSYWGVDAERARAAWSDLLAGRTRPAIDEQAQPRGRPAPATAPGPAKDAAPGADGAAPPPDGDVTAPAAGDAAPTTDAGTGDAGAGDAGAGTPGEPADQPADGGDAPTTPDPGGSDPPAPDPDEVDAPSAPQP